ncbi:MAG TPA: FAD-dependent oxidoreductase [Streptosporangiaceae bacterium]|nr:FAD-dependent oxidoreductase [Streptosporangiaceae bacterium]
MVTDLIIGVLVLGLVVFRQVISRPVADLDMRVPLIVAVLGAFELGSFLDHKRIGSWLAVSLLGSLVIAAVFGMARAATVRIWLRDGQAWAKGTWLTGALWAVSLAAHLGYDALVTVRSAAGLGSASILLYLAVTYAVQRLVIGYRAERTSPAARSGRIGAEVPEMQRRTLLGALAMLPLVSRFAAAACGVAGPGQPGSPIRRVRPGEPGWPGPAEWAKLANSVGGRLVKVDSPFVVCAPDPGSPACADLFQNLKDPFYIDDSVALTQTLGWVDAWTSEPSAYAVLAQSSADVAAAVNFAREHRVRLVVKGGGHSYTGGSNAAHSLLIWTRPGMQAIELLGSFVPQGASGQVEPETAVSVGAGAIWMDAYNAVTTIGGRYVQGGGCTTVGVAGLVQGGGFGSFSKGFGTAGANLLEAEVVTADGTVRIANAVSNPDLFWALKGGGAGTFGVVTRLTLRTHPLPDYFGAVFATIAAASDAAYLTLVGQVMSFYRESLLNPHWGEQLTFGAGRQVSVGMLFQGLTQAQAEQTWALLFAWVTARSAEYTLTGPGPDDKPVFLTFPARGFWNPAVVGQVPGLIVPDDLSGSPKNYYYWATNAGEVGQVLHAFESTWLSQKLLDPQRQPALVDALIRASQFWQVSLHCNKGLAGAPANALDWTKDTPMNPAVLDSFALAIVAANEPPAYPGIPGHEPDIEQGRRNARTVGAAMAPLKALRKRPASYISETDYFQGDWQTSFWGDHYARLAEVKERYDPEGLFFVHHGVGTSTDELAPGVRQIDG